jgi:hypothetical protein
LKPEARASATSRRKTVSKHSTTDRRLAGDTARSATTSEVKDLKRQALELKEVVAEQALELRLLKKSMTGDGDDEA